MKILAFVFFLFCLGTNAQIQQEFFADDVNNIELLTVNFCIDNYGKTSSVTILPEQTTYKNQANINQVVEYRKSIEYYPDSKLRNNCYDYTFRFVNPKYKNKKIEDSKISMCKEFKNGTFKYNDDSFPNLTIERDHNYQTEKSHDHFSKYKIDWINDTNYVLTFLEVSDKDSSYLIGEKIYVEIIDILDDGSYVYKSNLLDRTFTTGIIKRIN